MISFLLPDERSAKKYKLGTSSMREYAEFFHTEALWPCQDLSSLSSVVDVLCATVHQFEFTVQF